MAELLLELFSEEIPARMQVKASEDLSRLVTTELKDAGLTFDSAEAHVTPRRLALVVRGLPDKQPDVKEERKGPRVGAPDKAIEGFLKAAGVASVDDCQIQEDKKGQFYVVVKDIQGRATAEVLSEILPKAINGLPWPKSMRWGANALRWVRPLQNILCVLDGAVVPFDVGPVVTNNQTFGHRFMAPDAITVSDFDGYTQALREAYVILDHAERKAAIKSGAEARAVEEGYSLKSDEGLLNEVAGLVEWPVVLSGKIDDEFMVVPQEVLITSMKSHQKYFSCLKEDGTLAPRFIVVANKVAPDGGEAIVAGNERVLRARLSDAKFFWDQDHKKKLEDRLPALEDMVFHAKLGTVLEKVSRLESLSGELAGKIDGASADIAKRAAKLAKADLVSEMVFEFPEVQGIMGRYLARDEGEQPEVAEAIADHYSPQGPGDNCPSAPDSVAVALADKLDTLVGFWAIDEKPTGSKDPFALRRAALGVIRLVLENNLRLSLVDVFETAIALHGNVSVDKTVVARDLMAFFADRLRVHLKDDGIRHDMINAVLAKGDDDLVRLVARAEALKDFLGTDDGVNLVAAYRRAANIVKIEEKKDGIRFDGDVDASKLDQAEEKDLFGKLTPAMDTIATSLEKEDFKGAMEALAALRAPVDAFFEKVTVNSDDAELRANRLRLLSQIGRALDGIADFQVVEG